MLHGKRIAVILPAYNASKTLEVTFQELPHDIIDDIILVDDASSDGTAEVAHRLGLIHVIRHEINKGYGGNQKTCYDKAIELKAEIIIMVHPDYQYTPKLVTAMASIVAMEVYPVVFGSRILGNGALRGGMPLYKYFANRVLTFIQNFLMGQKLSEYHTGYRAFDSKVLNQIPFRDNSNDFIFDNQMVAQIFMAGFEVGEVTCPTHYFDDASSINFRRSMVYGLGVLKVSLLYRLQKIGLLNLKLFKGISSNEKMHNRLKLNQV
jgi:glycosyltransferase involved in cell wall biosynthesis